MTPYLTPPPHPYPRKPALKLPRGTVDCHMHLFGPASRYPVAADARYISEDALPETYIALMDRFGIAMGVFVPASPHGTDPSHLIDVLRRYPDRFRGVAILDADPDIGLIKRLADVGVKGVRFQSASYGSKLPGLSLETAARIHDFGWHVQLYPSGAELVDLEPLIRQIGNRVVIDHFGAMPAADGADQPAFRALLRLLDTGRVWVKLSRPAQLTREDPPYPSVTPLARALVRHAPERLLWATDWPHVGMVGRTMPDDGDLVDLLADWVPDEQVRKRILVDNPDAFYELDGAALAVHPLQDEHP